MRAEDSRAERAAGNARVDRTGAMRGRAEQGTCRLVTRVVIDSYDPGGVLKSVDQPIAWIGGWSARTYAGVRRPREGLPWPPLTITSRWISWTRRGRGGADGRSRAAGRGARRRSPAPRWRGPACKGRRW